MSSPSISMVSWRGTASVLGSGDTVRAVLSHDFRGRITCDAPLVVYRERSRLDRLRARLKGTAIAVALREGGISSCNALRMHWSKFQWSNLWFF
jgi:hypothetical protein